MTPFPVISPPLTYRLSRLRWELRRLQTWGPGTALYWPLSWSVVARPQLLEAEAPADHSHTEEARMRRRAVSDGVRSLCRLVSETMLGTHTCNFQSAHWSALASLVPSHLLPNAKLFLTPGPLHRLVSLPGCSAPSLFTYLTPIHSRTSPPPRSLPSQLCFLHSSHHNLRTI